MCVMVYPLVLILTFISRTLDPTCKCDVNSKTKHDRLSGSSILALTPGGKAPEEVIESCELNYALDQKNARKV